MLTSHFNDDQEGGLFFFYLRCNITNGKIIRKRYVIADAYWRNHICPI
ncbi:hypothetical protein HMPREF1621_01459 [Escherichia coli A25922R]|nr:hypothetical protein HMPREF9539_03810 [Escherichia coli MS 110-3]ESC94855.1 hypothetical protein HMPREF1593_03617 [Escherichia coli 907391]ESE36044.1 hypothetical protein HMPREF1621_01459 [Escherichia coli A25922R]